jgi:hypothetical protein
MNVLPGVAPVALLLARTGDTVVVLTGVRGYQTGLMSTPRLVWALSPTHATSRRAPSRRWGSPNPLDGEPCPDELLRFGGVRAAAGIGRCRRLREVS